MLMMAFSSPAEAGTHLPSTDPGGMEGWVGLGGQMLNKCPVPGIEPEHGHPSQY